MIECVTDPQEVPRSTRDFRFTVEQNGDTTRAIFEFRRAPDDRRLSKVVDYLYRSSALLPEATR